MSKNLLVVDDAMIIRAMITDTAAEAGWDVVGEACNGKEAIDQYILHRPDVVTLDIVMPEYNGLYALQGIMEIDSQARVIVVSALDQQDLLKEAFQLGAVDFVCKPYDRDHLVETLEKALPLSIHD